MCRFVSKLKGGETMRTALMQFRTDLSMEQKEIAKKIGVSRQVYGFVERNKRTGTVEFWQGLLNAFNVPLELWVAIQKNDLKAYNELIFKDEDCKKWFEKVRLNNANKPTQSNS